jgi:hypothetical protein
MAGNHWFTDGGYHVTSWLTGMLSSALTRNICMQSHRKFANLMYANFITWYMMMLPTCKCHDILLKYKTYQTCVRTVRIIKVQSTRHRGKPIICRPFPPLALPRCMHRMGHSTRYYRTIMELTHWSSLSNAEGLGCQSPAIPSHLNERAWSDI